MGNSENEAGPSIGILSTKMVSADNLNLDVLELIFSYLSGNDLPSVALVSRSFLTAVIPKLYKTLSYHQRHAKGYEGGETMSPFASLVAHPGLAIHVHNIEIRSVPNFKARLHSGFIRECRESLRMCSNLKTFECTVPNILSMFLPSLKDKGHLENVRISSNLTPDQSKMLLSMKNLKKLSLELASWTVVDVLPKWTSLFESTLTVLTLYMISDLYEGILESVLSKLPNLLGLHVVSCPRVDHLAVLNNVSQTSLLQSLSFTTSETTFPLPLPPPPLHHLRHLAIDVRYLIQPSPSPSVLASVLSHLKLSSPSLVSFTIKLPEKKVVIGDALITQLMENYGFSLRRIAFYNCGVSKESIIEICEKCLNLERLDVAIPMKDLPTFIHNISHSQTLTTIVDVDNHVDHGLRPSLNHNNVRLMMLQGKNLRKIVTGHRIWTGRMGDDKLLSVSLERRLLRPYRSLWFIPTD